MLQPLKAVKSVWYTSWTKLWGWTQTVSGASLLALSELNTYVSDPTFKSYLADLDVPKEVTITLAIVGIMTWLAHGRNQD